jgi:O-antigen ligase
MTLGVGESSHVAREAFIAGRLRSGVAVRTVLTVVLVLSAAIALGAGIHKLPPFPLWAPFVAVLGIVVFGFVVTRGPRACLAAIVLTSVLGFNQWTAAVGGSVSLRIFDALWIALVVWTIQTRAVSGRRRGNRIGQRQLAIWLGALGVSLYPIFVHASDAKTDSLIAWLRLVQTVSLVWLVPYALRRIEDFEFMFGVIELAATAEILRAIVVGAAAGELGQRLQGSNGPNPTGLLAALLIAAAIHAPVPRSRPLRAFILVTGLFALFMSHSIGSMAATAAMLGIFGLQSRVRTHHPRPGGLLVPARFLLLLLAVLGVAAMLRPENLPTSTAFERSTTMHRAVLAAAGLELFVDHPLVGVGWGRSPLVIGSDEINVNLQRRFGQSINPDFLPKENPTGVHNAYIQILAEAGVMGFVTFVALGLAAAAGIRSLLRRVIHDPGVFAYTRCALVLLVGVLVWWNDNAFYGAQPETVLAATMLGALAAVPLGLPRQHPSGVVRRINSNFSR